jgi:hypothetical protein
MLYKWLIYNTNKVLYWQLRAKENGLSPSLIINEGAKLTKLFLESSFDINAYLVPFPISPVNLLHGIKTMLLSPPRLPLLEGKRKVSPYQFFASTSFTSNG